MERLKPAKGFLGIDPEERDDRPLKSTAVIIPFGLEASVSYGGGTAKGPEAIIKASHQVELFDEDLWCEPFREFGVETLASFPIKQPITEALDQLDQITTAILNEGKFPMILGGEHSLSVGPLRAVTRKYGQIAILHFDAHADLRDGYDGEHYSHAAALRRCLDLPQVRSLVSCGIRNISAGEIPFLEANPDRIHIHWAKDKARWNIDEIIAQLGDRPVYLSFDIDGFDSSLMPATGTPEPGGMFWDDVIPIIKRAAQTHRIIGADVVELAPHPHLHGCNFLTAKLVYKILSYSLANTTK